MRFASPAFGTAQGTAYPPLKRGARLRRVGVLAAGFLGAGGSHQRASWRDVACAVSSATSSMALTPPTCWAASMRPRWGSSMRSQRASISSRRMWAGGGGKAQGAATTALSAAADRGRATPGPHGAALQAGRAAARSPRPCAWRPGLRGCSRCVRCRGLASCGPSRCVIRTWEHVRRGIIHRR